jgi:tRNA dimethylallyltransferase
VGPTAVGKTGVSLAVADEGPFDIISADSIQVYKYLDIGSGKPDRAVRDRVRHYLIDWVEPDFPFTAGDFCRDAMASALEVVSRGSFPLIVGGTGLYIDSFFQGLSEIPEVPPEIRECVRDELTERGLPELHEELLRVDPGLGGRIHPHDTQRITRGLEVYRATGRPLSGFYDTKRRYGSGDVLYIGLQEERAVLLDRINRRVDRMVELGLVDEVRSLRERGFGPGLKSMSSIGYAEINAYLDGGSGLEESIEAIKDVTRKYAKRQMTWFRKNKRVRWFRPDELEKIRDLLRRWLQNGSE